MSYFCNTCDKTIKLGYKKRHLNSKIPKTYSDCIVDRYYVENPEFFQIPNILAKHISDFSKKFDFFTIRCGFKLVFDKTIYCVKSNSNSIRYHWDLRPFLLAKISDHEQRRYKFSHISEMKITFITLRIYMTYEYYLKQPKSMLQWNLIKKIRQKSKYYKKMINKQNSHHLLKTIYK